MLRSSTDLFVCEPCYTLRVITAGQFDGDLMAWGAAAAGKNVPLICEWGTEANGAWFPWNASHNGGPGGASLFQDAFRHIVETIRRGGGTDITWVFHLNYDDNPDDEWNRFEGYDPGPDHTDWVGVSFFGAQIPGQQKWEVFSSTFDQLMKERLSRMAGDRPIMICEFGFTVNQTGGADAVCWADDALASLLPSKSWFLLVERTLDQHDRRPDRDARAGDSGPERVVPETARHADRDPATHVRAVAIASPCALIDSRGGASEKGTSPFCSQGTARSGQSPTVLG
jgi:hypothetical protein